MCGVCGVDEPGDRFIAESSVPWVQCKHPSHGPRGQWFHRVCIGVHSDEDLRKFEYCPRCQRNQKNLSQSQPAGVDERVMENKTRCSPRCRGCRPARTCDLGMDFMTIKQREVLWRIVKENECAGFACKSPLPGSHVSVEPFPSDAPLRKAKVLYWGRKTAGVLYLDTNAAAAPEKDRVDQKRIRWHPPQTHMQLLLKRASAVAAHVGLPYGESQARHEISYLHNRLKRLRSTSAKRQDDNSSSIG